MNYIQLKESVIRLNTCLKILPEEDKAIVKKLINKYNKQIKVFANVDFTNQFFTSPENRSIATLVGAFKKRKIKPFEDEIERIEENIAEITGFHAVILENRSIYDRLSLIYDERYSDRCLNWRDFIKDSNVWKNSDQKYTKFYKIYEKKLAESVEYKEAEEKLEQRNELLENFDISVETKNYIAMRKLITQKSLYIATFKTIMNEAELQFLNYEASIELRNAE